MMYPKLEGLIAAPFTAMHADGSVNLDMIEVQAEHLVKTHVSGAFICGTTGEGVSLTVTERRSIAERWMRAAGQSLRIIVHTGHNCLEESRALARHAQQIGVYATAAMPPSYFKPARLTDMVQWCKQLALESPGLPFYYYHIPSMTGVTFSMAAFLKSAGDHVPNLAGVKFTYENLMDFSRAMAVNDGRFDMLFGRDEILLCGLTAGARGAVGSTYNFAAPIYHRLIAAFDAGDLDTARLEQQRAAMFIEQMMQYGGVRAGKAIMKMIGIDCGPVRLPLGSLSDDDVACLQANLKRIGFFNWIRDTATHGGMERAVA